MDETYQHRQIGYVILAITLIVIGIFISFSALDFAEALPLSVMGIVILILLNFATLTVRVNQEEIKIHFGPGFIHKRISLDEVRHYQVVKQPWYWGYGIRLFPRGVVWNVSGHQALEVIYHDGRRFRIGTDDPEGLYQALIAHAGTRSALASKEAPQVKSA